jgi:hypothetical protein
MTYSGLLVLVKKIFKWPHPILAFLDFLPFEEDLTLYLNNLEVSLPKDDLCQVWWNWSAGSGEKDFFFQYKHMEI